MRTPLVTALAVTLALSCSRQAPPDDLSAQVEPGELRPSAAFASISDDEERARALFTEMARVFQHPRCVNCHPAGDSPLQGDGALPHHPVVVRGEDGHGAPGLRCDACHGESNFQSVPGAPGWHLAPREMAWQGLSVSAICDQIKDPARNGGLDLAGLIHHIEEDRLVGWGWRPPEQMEPAPGSQARLGDLTRAWVAAGAHCP